MPSATLLVRTALLSALVAGAASPLAAQSREEILSYRVEIDVRGDASMHVREEIAVRALGEEIQRGIYRDIPTSFPRASGLGRIEAPLEVGTVLRDSAPEAHTLRAIGGPVGRGGVRIRIGDPDVYLDPGAYTYTIEYDTHRWVAQGAGADQLYWNVTGNGWGFPIREVSARVRVQGLAGPEDVTLESWQGAEGASDEPGRAAWDASAGGATFASTRPLGAGEGLTLRITFPKGIVAGPTDAQRAEWFRLDWGGYLDAAYVLAARGNNRAARVTRATAPDPRRSDAGIAVATSRSSNDGDGAVPP